MAQPGVGFTRLTASAIVNEGETLLYGCLLTVTVDTSFISIYEGLDAVSGRLLANVLGLAIHSLPVKFDPPIFLDRGLYVVIGATVTEATMFWLPLVME